MDKALVALILASIAGFGFAGTWGLFWLLERALDTADRLRRTR